MSNYIKVSVPRMKNDGEQLHGDIEKIPQFVQELDQAMNALGRCWDGPAWAAFQQQVESDVLNMLDMYDWLRRFMQALSEGEKEYGACEKKSYACIEDVRI